MSSLAKIQHSFHRALVTYDSEAVVQKQLANDLFEQMLSVGALDNANRVFEFGCGTGFLSKQLHQNNIDQLILNDLIADSADYIDLANSEFIAGDIENITIPEQCDLICASSCVQWVQNLPVLLTKLDKALNDNGWLALGTFGEQHFYQINSTKPQDKPLNYSSLNQWQQLLPTNYRIVVQQQKQQTLWFDSIKALLLHLRNTGVNGNARQNWNQQDLLQFQQQYIDSYAENGKLPLSYHPIIIIAKKIS